MFIDSARTSFYQPYLPLDDVRVGLESGQLIQGTLRINQKNYEEAYIDNPDGFEFPDLLIMGLKDRNRAFQGDVVVVELNHRDHWIVRDSHVKTITPNLMQLNLTGGASGSQRQHKYCFIADLSNKNLKIPANRVQKTAKVVHITEAKGSRIAVGLLKPMTDSKGKWALFSPKVSWMPRMLIPSTQFPNGFEQRPQDFSKFLFVATVHKWEEKSKMAHAKLLDCLGNIGDVKAESDALLISNRVDTREFPAEILKSLPLNVNEPWTIPQKELDSRKDFRSFTVFTIDPATARDLDDALHVRRIQNCDGKGTPGWEVGVHIADVSYFLESGTELDKWARQRATSVYLVERVIPMLPRVLCEELCSLNPGVNRLTFSVVWKMTNDAVVRSQWIGRSVINSCVKLSYDHAQEMIDNPEKEVDENDLPTIFGNKLTCEIRESVLNLNAIAQILKKKRADNGSLRLDASKLRFALKSKNGMPLAVGCEERKDANFLVEEFMLLANMSIAKFIHSHYEENSLLRRHPAPKANAVSELTDKLEHSHCSVEFSSGKSIAASLNEYLRDEKTSLYIYPAMVLNVLRCIQLAVYFSSGTTDNYHHYALNVPFYTHFTSPIRRYPDVIVHRLLASALGYSEPSQYSSAELQLICEHCNSQKVNAKNVSDASCEMFFGFFIREVGFLRTVGVVVNVLSSAVDVLLIKYNMVRRIYTDKLKLTRKPDFYEGASQRLVLSWEVDHVKETREKRLEFLKDNTQPITSLPDDDDELDEHELILDNAPINDDSESRICGEGEIRTRQTVKAFTPLIVILTPIEDSTKFQCTFEPTTDDFPLGSEEIKRILST